MSVIQFVSSGGVAIVGGDLSKTDQREIRDIISLCGEKLQAYAKSMPVLVSHLHALHCNHVFVGKDTQYYHFVFTNNFGATNVNCRDLTSHGRVDLKSVVNNLKAEGDEVVWAIKFPANITLAQNEPYIQEGVVDYVGNILKVEEGVSLDKGHSHYNPVVSTPEIATGLEAFRKACPSGARTAVIIESGKSPVHLDIVNGIKSALDRHGIIGLRPDDRSFMDDPFSNIKTYMHACDFGIAVFDHLSADELNPEVPLELGYMLGLGKQVLLLRDKSLTPPAADLTANQYRSFDADNIMATIPPEIEQWLKDHSLL